MRRGAEYTLGENDDVLTRENDIHRDIDMRLAVVEDAIEAAAAGNRVDLDLLIGRYNEGVAGLAQRVERLLDLTIAGFSASVVQETAGLQFLTPARRQAIIDDVRGEVDDGIATLADLHRVIQSYATPNQVAEAVSAITDNAPTNRNTFAKLSTALDAVSRQVTEIGASFDRAAFKDVTDLVDSLSLSLTAVSKAQGAGFIGAKTWNDLKTLTSTVVGALAEVPVDDIGTHTDPVTGVVNTPNSGIFAWSQTPPGWGRLRPNDISALSADAVAAKARLQSLESMIASYEGDGYVVADPRTRMILRRETMDEVSMFGGRMGVQHTDDDVWRIVGKYGMIVAELRGGKIYLDGSPLKVTPTLQDLAVLQPRAAATISHIYGKGSTQFQMLRKGKARARSGGAPAIILCVGDSTNAGLNNGGSGVHRRAKAWPAFAAAALDKSFGANAAAVMGVALNTGSISSYTAYDPRVSVSAGVGIDTTIVSLGGSVFNIGETGVFTFNPGVTWDTAVVVTTQIAAASMTVDIGGAPAPLSPALGAIQKSTFTFPRGANVLNIRGVAGEGKLSGVYVYDSTVPQILIINAGRSGWRTDDYAKTDNFYSPGNAIKAFGADAVFCKLDSNDYNQSRDLLETKASLQTIINLIKAGGSDAVLQTTMAPTRTGQAYAYSDYVEKQYELADENNIYVIDGYGRYGTRAEVEAQGFATDSLHQSYIGHADFGLFNARFIDSI